MLDALDCICSEESENYTHANRIGLAGASKSAFSFTFACHAWRRMFHGGTVAVANVAFLINYDCGLSRISLQVLGVLTQEKKRWMT